jgi:indole-3-glycerol phosphate synthase
MPVSLDQIVAATRRRVAETKRTADMRELERLAAKHAPRGFKLALQRASATGPAVIAELKKASPSRGLIRADFDASALAPELERAGAAALSVLTDEEFFQGSLENLRRASATTKLPCLRKDFMVDEFQVLEARAHGADAILLIVAALSQAELIALARPAREHGLDVLCEAHDREELERAVDAGFDLIGVNNRDLHTFKVDIETAVRLAEFMPKDAVRVAESGIHNAADIAHLRSAGYHAFLIGESLMKAESPGKALQSLLAESEKL